MVYERDFETRNNTSNGRWRRILTGIVAAVSVAVQGFIQWRRRHAAINALNALDDAMLKDIGLHRSQIVDAVYRAEQRGIAGGRPNHEEAEVLEAIKRTGGDRSRSDQAVAEREAA